MSPDPLILRTKQAEILNYLRGKMGIAAVPGSGKTWTLCLLAAELVARGELAEGQEILIVTLVNSGVDHIDQRVSSFIQQRGLQPNTGYRVRTLHGLAHDIVRERPGLVGLSENFVIVDEREADSIREEAAQNWLDRHPFELDDYLLPEMDEGRRDWIRREHLPQMVNDIAVGFIRYAKDLQLTPQALHASLADLSLPLPLARMGIDIYADYQRSLAYRGAVDFDDLIRLALQALRADVKYLERLRRRWPYILEDEAQDSSRLQETILDTLAGPQGNWVRAGDPNQAIYETFTTASPRFLRRFLDRRDVYREELPNSGRSTLSLIRLANRFVHWDQYEHPVLEARGALQSPPSIEPTPPGDPQPNPPDELTHVFISPQKLAPQEELLLVADSLSRWLPGHPDQTAAVLVPRNSQGFELVDELRRRGLDPVDSLLRSSSTTRFSAGVLGNLLRYLADPLSASKLATVYRVWRRADREEESARLQMERTAEILRKLPRVEDFIWPASGRDWLEEVDFVGQDPEINQQLLEFRSLMQRWQSAVVLPVDQVLVTLSQDLLTDPVEMATAYKLSQILRQLSQAHPSWQLPELTAELIRIARNERRFLGLSEEDTAFDPQAYPGRAVVATLHKAKGLEWDRVYMLSVNNFDFPSGLETDEYVPEKWFIRDRLNLEAETIAQAAALAFPAAADEITDQARAQGYQEGAATHKARMDYVRERLRLLYVGITRTRKELILTWNTGRNGEAKPALPLQALQEIWR